MTSTQNQVMQALQLPATATEAARAGAQMLDLHYPGWFRRIELNDLNMESQYRCVISKMFNRYFSDVINGVAAKVEGRDLDLYQLDLWTLRHGLTLDYYEDNDLPEPFSYQDLTTAWRLEIQHRRYLDVAV